MKRYVLAAMGLVVGASLLGANIIGDRDIATTQLINGRDSYFDRDDDGRGFGGRSRHFDRDSDDEEHGFGRHFKRTLERAGASESQITEIEGLIESNRSAQREQHNQLEELEKQIRNELARDNPNRTTLENLIRQASDLRAQLTIAGINTRLEIQRILGNKIWEDLDKRHGRGRRRR